MKYYLFLSLFSFALHLKAQVGSSNVPVDNNRSPELKNYNVEKYVGIVASQKMNVFYIGVDNPITVIVPGLSNEEILLTATGSGITLRKNSMLGSGHYIVNVKIVGECNIFLEASILGKKTSIGTYRYRVKRVPDPIPTIANSKGGKLKKNVLLTSVLIPQLENFDFELFFRIVAFKMTIIKTGEVPVEFATTGNQLSQSMKDELIETNSGDIVLFQNIKATMNPEIDLQPRNLQPLIFIIE